MSSRRAIGEDRGEWSNPGAPRNQEQRATVCGGPNEVSTDGTAQLEAITHARFAREIGGNLTVGDVIHHQLELRRYRRRADRIAALRLIAIGRGQADIDML